MDPLHDIRWDVRELITINERLQSAVVQGNPLSDDERELVRLCAEQLLAIPLTVKQEPIAVNGKR